MGQRIGKTYVLGSTLISAALIGLLGGVLLLDSWPAITRIGPSLFSFEWTPHEEKFGLLSMLYGSMAVTFIALFIAVPLGLMSAIFMTEILPSHYRIYIKTLLEILAGIPSIIYGLIGIAFFSLWIGDFFHLASGRTLLCAGLLLSVMVLPTIITLCDDALQNVPQHYREASKGLGLYPYEVVQKTLLPMAKGGIIGAILLAFGRALGETMAVMLVIGSIDKIPSPFFNFLTAGQTITSKLGREFSEAAFGSLHFSALVFMGLLLMAIVLLLTGMALFFFKIEQRLHE